jgi:hypothetical protein
MHSWQGYASKLALPETIWLYAWGDARKGEMATKELLR